MIHSHDGPMHLARMPAYYKALTEGQIFPRWASDLNYGYGMPLFNFYYHIPYLASVLPMAMGASLVFSFKLVLYASFVLSGIFMFAFTKAYFKDISKAYVATILYQFAPFHMVDLFVRGDTGEGLAFAFLPLVLLFIIRSFESKNNHIHTPTIGLTTALLILSHSAVSLIYFSIILLFVLFLAPSHIKRYYALLGLGLGLGLSAFFWLPVLAERKFTYGDYFMKDMYTKHFVPLWMFFMPNITNNTNLQIGGIAITLGITHTIALCITLWQLFKQKILHRKLILYLLTLTVLSIIIMQPISNKLWSHISILRAFQFPWRFLTIPVFSLSMIGAAVLVNKTSPKWVIISIVLITILSVVVYFRPPLGFDKVDENYYWNYPMNTTYFGETDLVWSAGMTGKYPNAPFEIIEGEGSIQSPVKHDIKHSFTMIAKTPIRVVDNTQFFPGWRVFVDGNKTSIEFQDQNWRGLITFRIPIGTHIIRIEFGNSPIRQVAEIISITSCIYLVITSLFIWIKHKQS